MKSFAEHAEDLDNSFDPCRFTLATMVIVSHSFALLGDKVLAREPMVWLSNRLGLGSLAVNGFFVISGFLVSASYCHCPTTLSYFRNRALRIYPGLIMALLISAFVVAPLGGAHGPLFPLVWRTLLGQSTPNLPGAFAHNPLPYVNASLWTLRFEVFCYTLVPLLALLGCYRRPQRLTVVFLAAFLAFQWARGLLFQGRHFQLGPFNWLDELPHLCVYFLSGALLYANRHRVPRSPKLALVALVVFALTLRHGLEWTMPFTVSYLVLFLALRPVSPSVRRRQRWMGDVSYGMYLYASAIQQLLVMASQPYWGPKRLLAVSFPLSLLAGWLSWNLLEKPCLRLKYRPAETSGTSCPTPAHNQSESSSR